MYVLMDMEWVENSEGKRYPTQIAAMRVDERWELLQLFSSRIQPPDSSFHIWDHVSYTGGYANEFLSAPPAKEVFKMLQQWTVPEDVLCWWKGTGIGLFRKFAPEIRQPHKELYPYLYEYLRYCPSLRTNAYRMVDRMGLRACGISNHSKSDVKTMRAALEAVRFPQKLLACDNAQDLTLEEADCFRTPFVEDVNKRIVHKRGCPKVPGDAELMDQPTLARLERKALKLCSCCSAEYMQARREKNKKTIEKSEYSFVYTPTSNLFHKRNCILILNAKDILGSVYYKNCISLGRVPCQTCKPTRADEDLRYITSPIRHKKANAVPISVFPKPTPKQKPTVVSWRAMTEQEKRAIRRLAQAQSEREQAPKDDTLTQQQKADMMTLTQPRFAFWAASGYGSFHLRHCARLKALSGLKGFSLYEDAIRAGYQPCRQCKPTAKYNLEISMPIYSRERSGETVKMLENRCAEDGFQAIPVEDGILLETPKGIWRIQTKAKPYTLEHINKIFLPADRQNFHIQPKIFLSLLDAYTYIRKHDCNASEKETEVQVK